MHIRIETWEGIHFKIKLAEAAGLDFVPHILPNMSVQEPRDSRRLCVKLYFGFKFDERTGDPLTDEEWVQWRRARNIYSYGSEELSKGHDR